MQVNLFEQKSKLSYWEAQLDQIWQEQIKSIHPGKDLPQAIKESFGYLIADPDRLQATDSTDFKRLVNGWLSNKPFPKAKQRARLDLSGI